MAAVLSGSDLARLVIQHRVSTSVLGINLAAVALFLIFFRMALD